MREDIGIKKILQNKMLRKLKLNLPHILTVVELIWLLFMITILIKKFGLDLAMPDPMHVSHKK